MWLVGWAVGCEEASPTRVGPPTDCLEDCWTDSTPAWRESSGRVLLFSGASLGDGTARVEVPWAELLGTWSGDMAGGRLAVTSGGELVVSALYAVYVGTPREGVSSLRELRRRPSPGPWSRAGDLDGDRREDLLIFEDDRGGAVSAVPAEEVGERAPRVVVRGGEGWYLDAVSSVGDLDRDGVRDLLVSSSSTLDEDGSLPTPVAWLVRGDVAESRIDAAWAWFQTRGRFAAAGDVDGDRRADLVLRDLDGRNFLVPGRTLHPGGAIPSREREVRSAAAQELVASLGDIDGDGLDELYWSDGAVTFGASVLAGRSSPDGRLEPCQRVLSGEDLDGDAVPDLVFSGCGEEVQVRSGADLFGPPLSTLRGEHDPWITDAVWLPDIDGDGVPELALGDPDDTTVSDPWDSGRDHTGRASGAHSGLVRSTADSAGAHSGG